ncbi:hypothetical protein L249_8909, partial [Ophiocordyceps polyrhachis-furcata BCC 54312]
YGWKVTPILRPYLRSLGIGAQGRTVSACNRLAPPRPATNLPPLFLTHPRHQLLESLHVRETASSHGETPLRICCSNGPPDDAPEAAEARPVPRLSPRRHPDHRASIAAYCPRRMECCAGFHTTFGTPV